MAAPLETALLAAATALVSLILYLAYRLVWIPYSWIRYFRKQGIPGEPFVPVVGQLRDIQRAREASNADYWAYESALAQKHGPVFYICRGPEFRLCFNDPDVVLQSTSLHSSVLKLPVSKEASKIGLVQKSLIYVENADWKRQRRLYYNQTFHHSNLEKMFQSMQECCHDAVERWACSATATATSTTTQGASLDMDREMSELTLEIIVAATFGSRPSQSKEVDMATRKILSLMDVIQNHFFSGLAFLPGANWLLTKLHPVVREFHTAAKTFILRIITDYKRPQEPQERFQSILDALSANAADDNEEALSNAMLLLLAGHETTANQMKFVLYLLDEHPQWWDAVRKEVFAVCGSEQLPTVNQTRKELPICNAVIAEALRLFPIFPELSRSVGTPITIRCQGRPIHLPVGTPFVTSIVAGHRDPNLWDRPELFDPTRFLRDDVTIPAAYAPFSRAGRTCLGKYFAQMESTLILATIAQRLHLSLTPSYRHHPVYSITLRPKHGMPMTVRQLTIQEKEKWTINGSNTTKEQRIQETFAIPHGPPMFDRTMIQPKPTAAEPSTTSKRTRLAPLSKSDFGIRSPWFVRLFALFCYVETARRGAVLLWLFAIANDTTSAPTEACIGLGLYTLVYGVESFVAIGFRWISLQDVHLYHMYEHHLAGFGLGAAISLYVACHPNSWDSLLLDLCYLPLSLGFLAQVCEAWSIVRTFCPNPDAREYKVVQRVLGATLMTALPLTILQAFHRYITEYALVSGVSSWSEAGMVVLSMYLACLVHPSYVRSHLMALEKLLNATSTPSKVVLQRI